MTSSYLHILYVLTHSIFSHSSLDRLSLADSSCKTKPKAKWLQSSTTLQWQLSKINPRSKVYLNAIFTLSPEVVVQKSLFARLKCKPRISVQFYHEDSDPRKPSSVSNDSQREIQLG